MLELAADLELLKVAGTCIWLLSLVTLPEAKRKEHVCFFLSSSLPLVPLIGIPDQKSDGKSRKYGFRVQALGIQLMHKNEWNEE